MSSTLILEIDDTLNCLFWRERINKNKPLTIKTKALSRMDTHTLLELFFFFLMPLLTYLGHFPSGTVIQYLKGYRKKGKKI